MSPRKHWDSLKKSLGTKQNQEESVSSSASEIINESYGAEIKQTPSLFEDDELDIPQDAFSLFDEEEPAEQTPAVAAENPVEDTAELLLDEAPEEDFAPQREAASAKQAYELEEDDMDIPQDAFSMFDDEEEPKPAAAKKPVQKPVKAPVKAQKEESRQESEEKRKPRKDKSRKPKEKSKESYSEKPAGKDIVFEANPVAKEEQISESLVLSSLDDSVVHTVATQAPVFYAATHTEVTPVAAPVNAITPPLVDDEIGWESSPALLDDLIPDSEIERVNRKQKKSPKPADKKREIKPEIKRETKPMAAAFADDDLDIPQDAFSMFDEEVQPDAAAPEKKSSKPDSGKKREKPAKPAKFKPVLERIEPEKLEVPEMDEDIPQFAWGEEEAEEKTAPAVKPERPAKTRFERTERPERSERPERKERRECTERTERTEYADERFASDEEPETRPARRERPVRKPQYEPRQSDSFASDSEESVRPRRAPRSDSAFDFDDNYQPSEETQRRIREGEIRRPAVNIPSWKEVMDVLVEMNLNRRHSERPARRGESRSERPARSERPTRSYREEAEEIARDFDAPPAAARRRRRRPE